MEVEGITPVLNVPTSAKVSRGLKNSAGNAASAGKGLICEGPMSPIENEQGPASFGSVCTANATIFLCCGAQGSRGTIMPRFPGDDNTDGVWMTWWLGCKNNVDEMFAVATENKMIVTYPPTDGPWGVREFHLRHPDGHMFRISCGIDDLND